MKLTILEHCPKNYDDVENTILTGIKRDIFIDPNQSSRDPTIDVNMSKSNIRYSASGWRNMTFRVSPPRATNATCQIEQEIMDFSGQIPLLLTQNVRKMIAPLAVTRPTKYSAL